MLLMGKFLLVRGETHQGNWNTHQGNGVLNISIIKKSIKHSLETYYKVFETL